MNTWLGKYTFEIKSASEPTDIIWENRQFTQASRIFKGIIVTIIITILLAISFYLILICSKASLTLLNKYPSTIECDALTADKTKDELQA